MFLKLDLPHYKLFIIIRKVLLNSPSNEMSKIGTAERVLV